MELKEFEDWKGKLYHHGELAPLVDAEIQRGDGPVCGNNSHDNTGSASGT